LNTSENIITLGLPYREVIALENNVVALTLGEYILPHACVWMYSNLKNSIKKLVYKHEIAHTIQRGSPLLENVKIYAMCGSEIPVEIKMELEGLSMSYMIIEPLLLYDIDRLNLLIKFFETACENGEIPEYLQIFIILWSHLMKHSEKTKKAIFSLGNVLARVYHASYFTFDKNGRLVRPTVVLWELFKKLKEMNIRKASLKDIKSCFELVEEEKGWSDASPRHIRTFFSLYWSSILNEKDDSAIQKIALRNFFEIAFWVPINIWFSVDTNFFIQRVPMLEVLSKARMMKSGKSELGKFIQRFTEKILSSASALRSELYGEEKFILNILPSVASDYIQMLVDDFKSDSPKFFTSNEWQMIMKSKVLANEKDLGNFMKKYDKKYFYNTLTEIIKDSLYYPEDCIKVVEKNAKEAYYVLTQEPEVAKMLFEY